MASCGAHAQAQDEVSSGVLRVRSHHVMGAQTPKAPLECRFATTPPHTQTATPGNCANNGQESWIQWLSKDGYWPTFGSVYRNSHKGPLCSQALSLGRTASISPPLQGWKPRVGTTCTGRTRYDEKLRPSSLISPSPQCALCMFSLMHVSSWRLSCLSPCLTSAVCSMTADVLCIQPCYIHLGGTS